MPEVLSGILVDFGVIFVAELGDKSQLIALTFSTRYRALPVLAGITIATSVVHLISVAVGLGLGTALPTSWIAVAAAVAFLGFAAWTLKGDSLTEQEQNKFNRGAKSAVIAASAAFFLAELGDKTMLATVTLATQNNWFGVWLGSTAGMVAADALAILLGRQIGNRMRAEVIRYGAALLFAVFGVVLLCDAVTRFTGRSVWQFVAVGDRHPGVWLAFGLALAACVLVGAGRRCAHVGRHRVSGRSTPGSAAWWSRVLFVVAFLCSFIGPLLLATGVVQPVATFVASPGIVAAGAGVGLLGLGIIAAALAQMNLAHRRGASPILATTGPYARVRQPVLTGTMLVSVAIVLAAPTAVGALGSALIIAAGHVESRRVCEPLFSRGGGEVYARYHARTGRFLPRLRTAM
ncbi:MAG TPA: TMEM165/GDT1 family protein [Amycolatopsis sp.]|uniref:TMEM165/GDT1 family protein n=1 Tax=Amycolatopsis sp. TaxID=37632 RepID=UPI002B465140|nr:TMEM165/GDT1 family protein [Amycolatopsis sp.]HKS46991.1 TMEM165/GDT1 family protein [Amycolatopsis sp.]